MIKLSKLTVLTLLLSFLFIPLSVTNADETPEFAWVLKEVVDYDQADRIADWNKSYEGVYTSEVSYSRGTYYEKRTYVGNTDTWYTPPKVNGEHLAVTSTWSSPPDIIKEGEVVSLNMSISVNSINKSFYGFDNATTASFDIYDIKPGYGTAGIIKFTDSDGNSNFRLYSGHYDAISKTVTATPRNGTGEGDLMSLTIGMSTSAGKIGTKYIYEWTEAETKPVQTQSSAKSTPVPNRIESKYGKDLKDYIVPKIDGKYKDSGVRFSDLSGDVQIRHADDPIGWEFAEMDTVIYVGDVIKTDGDSYAHISLSDMTVFEMQPNSSVFMNTESEESQLSLLAGKLMANFKRMVIDGEMGCEMSQGAAGIKGTTFVLESNDRVSTLKVLEGTVEFTTNDGETILVTDNEMVTAKKGVAGDIKKFSAVKELSNWSDTMQAAINSDMEEKGVILDENYKSTGIFIYVAALLIAALIIFIFIKISRKPKKPAFCTNCGTKLLKNIKNCPNCNKPI